MANQSPMISIPKKSTDEVDWTTPIRNLIAQSYGESPDNYATECASLQRCRQDAVRGAGSDLTARDLLYKYFGQLELLELRFSEIRVNFPWRDAFTNKLTTQTSIAFEKASILFQIAATHSAIAAAQSRSDPEGLKRAFYFFRTCAGMLNYINENFLHAPSTDLSREVIKFLVGLILAQATEVFFEKCTSEKKGNALVSKVASQAASMYNALNDEVKEFMGKGIFDRNWVTVIQIKAKYFSSLTQYHRGLADNAASNHGEALARFTLADTLSKEASKLSSSFSSSFVLTLSPNLPVDAGTALHDRIKAYAVITSERKAEAQRENDLIYNAITPSPETLPLVDKLNVATPVHIHDVYGAPDVQKTIGQDFFIRLVPLSVHESASVYSEEKAKLVRGEVEKAEGAEGEARSALDGLGVKEGLARFRAMAEGEVGGEQELPVDVRRWKDDIALVEDRESVDGIMRELNRLKERAKKELESISRELEIESRDCEMMRVKYDHLWTQEPSASLSKTVRQDLKSHFGAIDAAAVSDQQVYALWDGVRADIQLLLSPEVEDVFRRSTEHAGMPSGEHLLDLDVGSDVDDAKERAKIRGFVDEIDERLGRLNKIARERNEVLKDLKEKIQTDDVSHLLLLNRRNTGVEPTLFAAELEKFRPYQQRLASTVQQQEIALSEVAQLWKGLKDLAGRGPGARKWDDREKRKKDTVRRFSRARDVYMEVRDGLAKGLQFYTELVELSQTLRTAALSFVASRVVEREKLAAKLEADKRMSATSASSPPPPLAAKPPLPPPPSRNRNSLEASFAGLGLRGTPPPQQQQPQQNQWGSTPSQASQQQQQQPYYSGGSNNQYSAPPQQSQQPQHQYGLPPPPPPRPPVNHQYSIPPPPNSPPGSRYGGGEGLPPPPRPYSSSFQPNQGASSTANQQSSQVDPYASLGMFNPGVMGGPVRQGSLSLPPPPPPQQQQSSQQGWSTGGYGQPQQQPQQQQQQPQLHQLQYQQHTPQQQQYQPQQQSYQLQQGFPPPPPPLGYQQQQPQQQRHQYGVAAVSQYQSPPLPPQQQQQQQQPNGQSGYGGYGGGQFL